MARDAPVLFLQRQGEVLRPHARFDAAILEGYRQGVKLRAELTEGRSHGSNRLYWSVLKAVCDATGKWQNPEALHKSLKLFLGVVDTIAGVHGEPVILPGSTAFRNMDEPAFRDFTNAAFETISTEICPGLNVDALLSLGRMQLGAVGAGECQLTGDGGNGEENDLR